MAAEPPLELPAVLRALLLKTRLTQRKFANECGISTNEVNDILRGRRRLVQQGTFDALTTGLARLAPAAGITPDELARLSAAWEHDHARYAPGASVVQPPPAVPLDAPNPTATVATPPSRPALGARWWRRLPRQLAPSGASGGVERRRVGALATLLLVVLALLGLVIAHLGRGQAGAAPPTPAPVAGPPLVAGLVPRCPTADAAAPASPLILRMTYPLTTRCTNTAAGMALQFVADPALVNWYAGEVDVIRSRGLMPPEQNTDVSAVFRFAQPADSGTAAGLIVLTPEQAYGGTIVLLNAGARVWQVLAIDSHAQHTQVAAGVLPASVHSAAPITLTVQLQAHALFVGIDGTWVSGAIPLSADEVRPLDRSFGFFVDCPIRPASSVVLVQQVSLQPVR